MRPATMQTTSNQKKNPCNVGGSLLKNMSIILPQIIQCDSSEVTYSGVAVKQLFERLKRVAIYIAHYVTVTTYYAQTTVSVDRKSHTMVVIDHSNCIVMQKNHKTAQ